MMFLCATLPSLLFVSPILCLLQQGHCHEQRPRQAGPSITSMSQSAWDAFNATVSGRLHNGEPMMAPCYLDYDGTFQIPNIVECSNLQNNRSDTVLVSDHFGGYINVGLYVPYHSH